MPYEAYEDGPLLGSPSPRPPRTPRRERLSRLSPGARNGHGNTIVSSSPTSSDKESLLAMGIIVDRSSFDSSDPQHLMTGGNGEADQGWDGAGDVDTRNDRSHNRGGRRKLRRRRMKWKPKLPKSNSDRVQTSYNAAPADDASAFGGHMSVVSAMSNGTNSTPRLSNQRSMLGRRRFGGGGGGNSDEDSVNAASVGSSSSGRAFGWGRRSGKDTLLESVPESQSPVNVEQQQQQQKQQESSKSPGRDVNQAAFNPYGDQSFEANENAASSAFEAFTGEGSSMPLAATPTKKSREQHHQATYRMSPQGESVGTDSTMSTSMASWHSTEEYNLNSPLDNSDFSDPSFPSPGRRDQRQREQQRNQSGIPMSRNRSDGNTICTPDGKPIVDIGLNSLPPLAPPPPVGGADRRQPSPEKAMRSSPVQGRHVSYSPTASPTSEGGRKTYRVSGGSNLGSGKVQRGSGAAPPYQLPSGRYDSDDELLPQSTKGGGVGADNNGTPSRDGSGISKSTTKLGKLAAASGFMVKPEEYLLAGMRPSTPRGERRANGVASGRDGNLRLDDEDGLSSPPRIGNGRDSPRSGDPSKVHPSSNGDVANPRRRGRGRSTTPVPPAGGAAVTPSPKRRSRSRSRSAISSATGPVDVDGGHFTEAEHRLRAIHQMGAEHLNHGEYAEAVEVFEEILRGQTERYGPRHERVGTALHNLGIVHLRKRDYNSAIRVCREAVEVRRGALGKDHLEVAVSLAQLGIAHLENNQHKMALIAFREALHIRRKYLGPKHPKIAKILNNIGCSLFELSEMKGAMLAFEETLDIQRSMMRSSPASNKEEGGPSSADQLLLSIAATQCNIGSIKLRLGGYDESIVALEEALLIQQSVLGDDHATVLNTIESIDFVDEKRNEQDDGFVQMKRSALSALGLGDNDEVFAAAGCTPMPPMLTKMMNVDVIKCGKNSNGNVIKCGEKSYQEVEDLAWEQMKCVSEVDSPPRSSR